MRDLSDRDAKSVFPDRAYYLPSKAVRRKTFPQHQNYELDNTPEQGPTYLPYTWIHPFYRSLTPTVQYSSMT
jgi:hypothetical protein